MIGLAPASLELREDEEQGRSMLAVAGQHGNRWLQTTGSPVQVQQAYYAVIADQPQVTLQFLSNLEVDRFPPLDVEITPPAPTDLKVVPGVTSTRLPFFDEFMPTGIQWDEDGTLWITSLKGRVWRAVDTDKDGMEDRLHAGLHELAAPYGVQPGKDFIDVVNKYALLRLFDRDRDGVYEQVQTVAAGWGHTADYHDWTVGPVSDGKGGTILQLPVSRMIEVWRPQNGVVESYISSRVSLLKTTPIYLMLKCIHPGIAFQWAWLAIPQVNFSCRIIRGTTIRTTKLIMSCQGNTMASLINWNVWETRVLL